MRSCRFFIPSAEMPKISYKTMAADLFKSNGCEDFNTQQSGELIPLQENNGKKAVNARDLHSFLQIGKDFSTWIKVQFDRCDLSENIDFQVIPQKGENPNGGRPTIEYALSISAAKEISITSQTERGKEARRYFIACEEKLKELASPSYMISDPIKRAEKWIEEEKERQQLALDNKIMKPKADYFDALVDRNMLTNLRDTAKQIHLTQNKFITLLLEHKFVYRDAKNKLKPYAEYIPLYFEMKDFEKNGHAGTQLLVNPKGKETFRLMWGGLPYEN